MNIKGAAILLACLIFAPSTWPLLLAGFVIPNATAAGVAGLAARVLWPISKASGDGGFYMRAARRRRDSPVESALIRLRNWSGSPCRRLAHRGAAWYWITDQRDGARAYERCSHGRRFRWPPAGVGGRFSPALSQSDSAASGDRGRARCYCILVAEARIPLRRFATLALVAAGGFSRNDCCDDGPVRPALFPSRR